MDTNTTTYTDREAFDARVGLITDAGELNAIGAPLPDDAEQGRYYACNKISDALIAFCRKNQGYHIVTETSESDGLEDELTRKAWLKSNPGKTEQDFYDLDEDVREDYRSGNLIAVQVVDNCWRYVNRENYYLAKGDDNPQISLTDIW